MDITEDAVISFYRRLLNTCLPSSLVLYLIAIVVQTVLSRESRCSFVAFSWCSWKKEAKARAMGIGTIGAGKTIGSSSARVFLVKAALFVAMQFTTKMTCLSLTNPFARHVFKEWF